MREILSEATESRAASRFLATFAGLVALLAPLLGLNAFFLYRAGELSDVGEIAVRQQESGGLYGSAVHNITLQYKLELLALRKPAVIALGSSRAMEFRADHFKENFLNFGGLMASPQEGRIVADEILARHIPRLVLLTLDFWWFNPLVAARQVFPEHAARGQEISVEQLLLPARWLITGRVSPSQYLAILRDGPPQTPGFPPLMGLRAAHDKAGFGTDGSWYYLNTVFGLSSAGDSGFQASRTQARQNKDKYKRGDGFAEDRWREIVALVQSFTEAGAEVVVVVPPLARALREEIATFPEGYVHLAEMQRRLSNLPVPAYDFHDAAAIGGNDCEFIDAHHAGDVLSARMIAAIAEDPASPLAGFADRAGLAKALEYSGFAMAPNGWGGSDQREIDFLELGCEKTAAH